MIDELLSQDEINALLSGADLGAAAGGGGGGGGDFTPGQAGVLDELAGIFSSSTSSVYGMLAGKEVSTIVGDKSVKTQKDFADAAEEPFAFRVTCGGLDDAPLSLVITERGALTLADLMMGGEGKDLPEEAGELYLNAAQEGLSQVVGAAFTSMSGLLGGKRLMPENISSSLESGGWVPFQDRSPDDEVWSVSVTISIEGLGDFPLWVTMPLDVVKKVADEAAKLISGKETPEAARPAAAPAARPAAPDRTDRAEPERPSSGHIYDQSSVDVRPAEFVPLIQKSMEGHGSSRLDLIADIPVRVTVELGRTRKNIADILSMTPGSVIELDKMAGEPVDILVNGKLVARGEVVVIDENFGVRITEIVSSAGRVHSL
ncbi:MAG: flagellar motor switch phosphatase FliY [Aminivibrio sp.]